MGTGQSSANDISRGNVVEIGDVIEYIYTNLICEMRSYIKNIVRNAGGSSVTDEPDNSKILGSDKADTNDTKQEFNLYFKDSNGNKSTAKIQEVLTSNNNKVGEVITAANLVKAINAIVTDFTRLRAYKSYTAKLVDYYYRCDYNHGSHFAGTREENQKTSYNYVFLPKTSKAYSNSPSKRIGNFNNSKNATKVKTTQTNTVSIQADEKDKIQRGDIIQAAQGSSAADSQMKSFKNYINAMLSKWKTYVENHSIFYTKITDGGTATCCYCSCYRACDGRSRR